MVRGRKEERKMWKSKDKNRRREEGWREVGKRKEISGKVRIKIEEGRDDWLGFRGTSF
jgi:hypothetical protein